MLECQNKPSCVSHTECLVVIIFNGTRHSIMCSVTYLIIHALTYTVVPTSIQTIKSHLKMYECYCIKYKYQAASANLIGKHTESVLICSNILVQKTAIDQKQSMFVRGLTCCHRVCFGKGVLGFSRAGSLGEEKVKGERGGEERNRDSEQCSKTSMAADPNPDPELLIQLL